MSYPNSPGCGIVWKIQRCFPVVTSKARMWPGVPGNVSGHALGRISRSSNTTPGVLALTLTLATGRSNPSRRSTRPSAPNDVIGWPVLPVERPQEIAIGHEHSIGVHGDTAMTKSGTRGRTAARIELPDLAPVSALRATTFIVGVVA